ncbi:MAG: hypothetical protein AB7I59_23215 [Geminicoccaceae bacterium]
MQDSAICALDEAPSAFVNEGSSHRVERDAQAKPRHPAKRSMPRTESAPRPEAEVRQLSFADGLVEVLRLQEEWRERIALMAHDQLAFTTATGREILAAGAAIAAEPELGRRMDLFWAQALHQLERSLEHSTRCMQMLGGVGDSPATGPRRRAG